MTLTSISGILPVLPVIISNIIGPASALSDSVTPTPKSGTNAQPEKPGVPLPAGTVSYGTSAHPSLGRAVDSAIIPHLTVTKNAFLYQTSFGEYSFNQSTPFLFNLSSRGGVPLTKLGFFFVNSTTPLMPGRATVTVATATEFQVEYEVRSLGLTVGNLNLTVSYQASVAPKFTISFSKTPLSVLGDFNIIWSTLTVQNWLRHNQSSSVLNIGNYQSLQSIPNVLKTDTGTSSDPSVWTDWLTTDWTDAGHGLLKVGFLNVLGRSGYGHVIVFDKNVGRIDPTQVSTSTATFASGYSTQRKTFNYAGYYFLFFYDGNNIVYQSSLDGLHWSPTFVAVNGPISSYSFDLYQSGMNLALAWLNYNSGAGGDGTTQLLFRKGVIVGSSVSWISVATVASWSQPYSWPPSVAIGTDGTFWAAGIWYDSSLNYNIWIYKSTDGSSFSLSTNYYTSNTASRDDALQLILLPQGQLMSLTSHYYDTTVRYIIWNPLAPSGPSWGSIQTYNLQFQASTPKWNILSATSSPDGFVHVAYTEYVSGNYYLAWAGYNVTSNQWKIDNSLLVSGSPVWYPSVSTDNFGTVYVFATLNGSPTFDLVYSYRPKGSYNWAGFMWSAFANVGTPTWISSVRSVGRDIGVVWTQPGTPNTIIYGSLPVATGIASGPPSHPWNYLGLSPYEQYFSQNGEYISPGSGQLFASQTDILVPGRNGLSVAIARVYAPPYTFNQGNPYNFVSSPYAKLGNSWQLNLPWVDTQSGTNQPYLHFLNGELFPVLWNSAVLYSSGGHTMANYTMTNHVTEDFALAETLDVTSKTINSLVLTTKDGTVYNFNNTGLLTSITDRTGQNQITLAYSGGNLSTITDVIGRTATFKYNPSNFLANVTYGGQTVKYSYSGSNLVTITDAANRIISLSYSPQTAWLLAGIKYVSGGNSTYTYGSMTIGTDNLNYYVTRQDVYTPGSVVKSSSFSYTITDGEVTSTNVQQSDGQTLQGSTNYLFNPKSSSLIRTVLNATQVQMLKQQFWYDPSTGRSIQQDIYSGTSSTRSFYNSNFYDLWGNVIYTRDNTGHESYQSFANTDTQWTFQGPGSLSASTNGKQLYDDFNGPALDNTLWTTGGSAASQTFNVANSQLNMTAKAATFGSWSSMWARSSSTYNYPFYGEIQMSLGQNPCSYCEAAELVISPQLTGSTGDPFNNNDALRVMIYDGVHYDIIKNVGGVQTTLLDVSAGGTWSVSWKIVLTDRNTLTVYLNRGWGGTGFVQVYSTTSLGLSSTFTPAYAYVMYRTTRGNLYSASFDYVGLTSSNTITVNGLQASQKVQLYDWNNNLQASGTVPTGQSSITLDATQMVFPYGYFQIYELDGRTVQFTSATREIYGGSTYSYAAPFRSGGTTRTGTGFLQSSSVYVEDALPSGAITGSGGGDAWVWSTSSYAPVASGTQSHVGIVAAGSHQHYFANATTTFSPSSGSFLIQYIYIPSTSLPSEIMVQFHDASNSWEHRAYWGSDLIPYGTNGTASRRSMGALPGPRDSWVMLTVKADDVGINGLTINGWAYTLYNGGTYWDYSALGSSSTGTITVNNLLVGQKVEIYDASGSLKTSGTVSSGSSVTLNLYGAGINSFPFKGSLKVYGANGGLQYSSSLMTDIWGGDSYRYNQPIFSNSFSPGTPGTVIHSLQIGQAQYQNATSTPEQSFSNFDSVGNLLKYSQIHNNIPLNTTYTYDIYGNAISSVNPLGETTYTSFSISFGRSYPTNITRVLGANTPVSTLYAYNVTTGSTISMTDARGNSTAIKYDSINRVTLLNETTSTGPLKLVTMVYNDPKNNFTLKNEKGNVTLVQVDQLGRSNSTRTYKTGNLQILATQNTTYTWLDQAKTVTRPDGNRTTYSYDYLGRLVKTTNPDATVKVTSYDDVNLVQINYDENNHRIDQLYDPMHRLIGVREYYSPTNYYLTSYTYDGVGNLAKTVDAKGQITIYTHDDLNRLTLTVFPDSYNETRTYDNVGNLQTKKDPNGNTINYSYDTLDRLTTVTYPNSTTANYGYDKNNNRISLSYLGNSATFRYDAWNRLTNETWIIGGSQYSVGYAYDRAGNLVALTYPDSTKITYSLDPLNDVSTVRNGATTLANVTYSAGNRIASISYGNGVKTTYTYDSRYRPTRMRTTNNTSTLLDLNYTYDAASNVVGINTETYTYDYLNRLTKSTGPWTTIQYGYDGVGNRLWMYQSSNTTYAYGSYDRLTSVGSSTYTYDNNGNLKTSGSGTYSYNYDYENRLTQIKQSSTVMGTYVYDPDGRRIQKTESSITTVYVNQGTNVLYEKQTSGGSTTNDYVYDNGLLIGKLSTGTAYYFHTDIIGNVRLVTKGSTTSFSSNYQPFGSQYGSSGSDPVYKYTGKPQDIATGLYYYGARYYDTNVGRFTVRDPGPQILCSPQSLNPYTYVQNNPETLKDSTGACLDTLQLALMGIQFFLDIIGTHIPYAKLIDLAYFWAANYLTPIAKLLVDKNVLGFVWGLMGSIIWNIAPAILRYITWWEALGLTAVVASQVWEIRLVFALANFIWSAMWAIWTPPAGICLNGIITLNLNFNPPVRRFGGTSTAGVAYPRRGLF